MTHLYFHCAGAGEILLDRRGLEVGDLGEARAHALDLARAIVAGAVGVDTFRDWLVYVSDEEDDEVLTVSFAAVLPTLH